MFLYTLCVLCGYWVHHLVIITPYVIIHASIPIPVPNEVAVLTI